MIQFIKENKKEVIIIFIVALLLRLIVAIIFYNNNIMQKFADDMGYYIFAERILVQGPLVLDSSFNQMTSIVAPGLPWILSIILFAGGGWLSIFVVNSFVSTFICILIFYLATQIFNKRTGLFASIWSVFFFSYVRHIPSAGKSIWMTLLILLIILTLIQVLKERKMAFFKILIFSFLFTYLLHIDERYLAYIPLFGVLILFLDSSTIKIRIKKSIMYFILVCLFMTPWLIRNFVVLDNIVILSTRTTSITEKFIDYKKSEVSFNHYGNRELSTSQIDSVLSGTKTHFSKTDGIPEGQIEEMKQGKFPHRYSTLENLANRLIDLWRPFKFSSNYYMGGFSYMGPWSLKHNVSAILCYGLLLPFFFIGLYHLLKRKKKVAIILLSILLYHSIIHMLFIPYTRDRYRIPLESIIIMLGVYGMLMVYEYFIKKKTIRLS